jgi:plastocyanin
MFTLNKAHKYSVIVTFLFLASFALAQDGKDAPAAGHNQIVIKDFMFTPMVLTVKSGEKITWINRDEEPHTVVSVEKQFTKSKALDTDDQFTITAGAPGTYTYFCSVHPKMTGTIIVEK